MTKKKNIRFILSVFLSIFLSISMGVFAEDDNSILYQDVLISGDITNATIANANTSRNLAVADDGTVYTVFRGTNSEGISGIFVSKSNNSGQNFTIPVLVTECGYEPEISVSSTGYIYVTFSDGKLNVYRSDDKGNSFRKLDVKDNEGNAISLERQNVHMATDGSYLYFIDPAGTKVVYNNNNGEGSYFFTNINNSYAYSDIHVDKENHKVIVLKDDPRVIYHVSKDNGLSFSELKNTNGSVYFSVGTYSGGQNGQFAFIAGQGTDIFRINIENDEIKSDIDIGNNQNSQGRSMSSDTYGNVVTGYYDGGYVKFKVSNNLGLDFGEARNVAQSEIANAFIDPTNGNILYAYQTSDGQIKMNVYKGLTIGYKLGLSSASLSFEGSGKNNTVEIENISDSNITISNIILDKGFSITQEQLNNVVGQILEPGDKKTIDVYFQSDYAGATTGLMKIYLDGESNSRNIILNGVREDGIVKIKGSQNNSKKIIVYNGIKDAELKLYDKNNNLVDTIISSGSGIDEFTDVVIDTGYKVTQTIDGIESDKSFTVDVIEGNDDTPPNISLIGEEIVNIDSNGVYLEQGAEAFDNIDGKVEVSITGLVNTNIDGEYTITYSSSDNSGNESFVTRTIKVGSADEQLVELDKNNLEIGFTEGESKDVVLNDLQLPTEGSNGTTITWNTSNPEIITTTGTVIRPKYIDKDQEVELTATITKDEISKTKTFVVKVLALDITDEESVEYDSDNLEIIYVSGDDEDYVTRDIVLTTSGAIGFSTISWESSDESVVTTGGVITLPTYIEGDKEVTLTATIKKGSETRIKEFKVIVRKDVASDEEAVALVYEQLEVGYASGNDKDNITQDLVLVTEGGYGTEISWESSDESVVTTGGVITLPTYTEGDKEVTLTATIKKGSETRIKEFKVIVRKDVASNQEATIKANNQDRIDDTEVQNAIQGAENNDEDTINIVIEEDVAKDKSVEINISKEQIKKIKDKNIKIKVQTGNVSIKLPIKERIINELDDAGSKSRLAIVCEQVDTDKNQELKDSIPEGINIYDNHVYDFKMKVIEENEKGEIINEEEIENYQSQEDISLRVFVGKDAFGEEVHMALYFNPNRGMWEFVRSVYNQDGTITMLTNHLSVYSVMKLTKNEKQRQLVAVVNKDGVTLNEILNVIEDKDMDFDDEVVKKYNTLTITKKKEIAEEIKTDKPESGYTYDTLKQKYNDETTKKYSDYNDSSSSSSSGSRRHTVIKKQDKNINVVQGKENINIVSEPKTNVSLINNMFLRSKIYNITAKVNKKVNSVITIDYDDKDVTNENQLAIYSYDKENDKWICIGGIVNKEKHQITIKIDKPVKISIMEYNKTFKDINNHWAKKAIEILAARNIISGDKNGNFNPNVGITRAEFATFISKILKLEIKDGEIGFEDISKDNSCAPYIASLKKVGILKGINDNQFAPNKIISRQEMISLVMRAYRFVNNTNLSDKEIKDIELFADNKDIGNWAKNDIYQAKKLNLIKGRSNNNVIPNDETLKGEAATLLYNFMKLLGQI